jgi:hypothetical protein
MEDAQPKEKLNLKQWQAHNLDDSMFKKPFCFQLVKFPQDYDVITQKNKENVITLNIAGVSSHDKTSWMQELNSTCLCVLQFLIYRL